MKKKLNINIFMSVLDLNEKRSLTKKLAEISNQNRNTLRLFSKLNSMK